MMYVAENAFSHLNMGNCVPAYNTEHKKYSLLGHYVVRNCVSNPTLITATNSDFTVIS